MPRALLPWIPLTVLATLYVTVAVEPTWRPAWDSGVYLTTARSLAAGEGYTYLGAPFFLRPPGLAWLLSFLVADGYDFALLNRVTMAFAATAVVALYLVLRRFHGTWIALAVALLTGTSPLFVGHFNFVLTEFPFLTLLCVAVLLVQRGRAAERYWWAWALAGGGVLGLALYVRTATLLVVPGLVLFALANRHRVPLRRTVVPAVVAALVFLPWLQHAAAARCLAERPATQTTVFSYGTGLLRVDPGDPRSARVPLAGYVERARSNGRAAAGHLMSGTLPALPAGLAPWAVLLPLAGLGWAARRRLTPFEGFVGAYAAVVLLYFTTEARLVFPLVPFVFLYLLAPAAAWSARRPAVRHARLLPHVLFGLLLASNLAALPRSRAFSNGPPDYPARVAAAAEELRAIVPPGAAVLAHLAPIWSVAADRTVHTYKTPHWRGLAGTHFDFVVLDHDAPPALERFVARRAVRAWTFGPEAAPLQAVHELPPSTSLHASRK